MNILLIYATNSSGAAVVADSVAAILDQAGHQVMIQHARDTTPEDVQQSRDLILLGSCTWERITPDGKRLEGQLQQHMYTLLEKTPASPNKKFAVFGLGDSSYTDFCAAVDHLETAVKSWGGELIVPSLRVDGYFFDLEKNRQRVTEWARNLAGKL